MRRCQRPAGYLPLGGPDGAVDRAPGPTDPDTAAPGLAAAAAADHAAAANEKIVLKSARRSLWAKLCLVGLVAVHVSVAVLLFSDMVVEVGSPEAAVLAFPGHAMALAAWCIAVLVLLAGLAADAGTPAFAVSPISRGAPAFTAISWLTIAVVLGAPVNIRLLWIECERLGQVHAFCTRQHVTAALADAALALVTFATLHTIDSEHRFRAWIVTNDKTPLEPSASIWSAASFSWFNDILNLGFEKPIELEDLNKMDPNDLAANINIAYDLCKKPEHSLIWNLTRYNAKLLTIQAFWALVIAFASLASPFFLRKILLFVQDPSTVSHPSIAVLYALAIFVFTILRATSDGQMYFLGRRIGLRVRSVLTMLIYEKSLRPASKLEGAADSSAGSGKIVNLMSSDTNKILEFVCYVTYLWMTPLMAIICVVFLVMVAGPAGLVGVLVMVLVIPATAKVGTVIATYQHRLMSASDLRINAVNELLQGIRIVKFFAWEPRFAEKIRVLRENELRALWTYTFTASVARVMWSATPVLVSFATFTSMTLLNGQKLDAATAFTALSIFNVLRMPLETIPSTIVRLSEALVSLRRIQAYLAEPEIDSATDRSVGAQPTIQFTNNACFSWSRPERPGGTQPRPQLQGLSLQFPTGGLTVIYGPTGGGKSSLLMALLGEMNCTAGGVHLGDLQRGAAHSPIAFAPQQVWLQNATIRENICFGMPFDPARYQATLFACALIKDLANLDGGDMTEVGEKGVNLSGGQKARIALARAVYSNSPVVVMDDPLSAVDAPTAKHLFEECICGPLMADRTRILVTHAKALCAPRADYLVRVAKGTITHATAPTLGSVPLSLTGSASGRNPSRDTTGTSQGVPSPARSMSESPTRDAAVKRLTSDEARSRGSVALRIYWVYCAAAGGVLFLMLAVSSYAIAQSLVVSNDLWLKTWADAYRRAETLLLAPVVALASLVSQSAAAMYATDAAVRSTLAVVVHPDAGENGLPQLAIRKPSMLAQPSALPAIVPSPAAVGEPVNLGFYVGVYAALGSAAICAFLVRVWIIARGSLHASRTLHANLVNKILRAPVQFFEKTPMGRILNRFSKDIRDIDQDVGFFTADFLGNCISTTTILGLILIVTPLTAVGIIPMTFLYVGIGLKYIRTSRELKRLDSTTRSPIFSHFGETINGAATIRAYAAQDRFTKEIQSRIDKNNLAFFNLWVSNRWLGIRVDLSGAMISLAASLATVSAVLFDGGINAGIAGLSISYALMFSESLLWLIRMHALMEMEINAVERVDEYMHIEEEAPTEIAGSRPPPNWPQNGNISVENLTLRYAPDADPVLSNVSFRALAGEKVAVVGRTGAGKTTLTLAFFRFLEAETGRILIDGVDIGRIGVHDLRSRLTVIPQDPVLFSGTLRSNMDPFSQYSDADIWNCLRHAHFLDSLRTDGASQASLVAAPSANHAASAASLPASASTSSVSTSNFSLEMPVSEGGANFSQGQRQLLCLARALLRQSKLIVLDEATASVDHDTDARIQTTIRTEFGKATLLCIAHRLRTIIDYDKVLVLDRGRVAEFGSPLELMANADGIFHSMCLETGEFGELREMAEKHSRRR
ncbi:Transporter of the ATP-binding cassette (ABC) [Polyrhizophydium stewartii]|uniref:Transporter of the ATP-binding cassette (ABC) n=1 Tax=Polyrhizophydium stewartii TaxID=2732419 RepID=A0ABR4MXX1_9FUNG|nr:hypothetical protein HK105_007659 [Polyrhizophydium stewartii]